MLLRSPQATKLMLQQDCKLCLRFRSSSTVFWELGYRGAGLGFFSSILSTFQRDSRGLFISRLIRETLAPILNFNLFSVVKTCFHISKCPWTWGAWEWNDDLRLRFTTPNVSCCCCARILYLIRVCFEEKVNIWLSKHHIQHISVAFGLFSILTFKGGFSYGNESLHDGFASVCFHSSNRPRSVSGPSIGKIFRLVFVNNTSSIVLPLKVYFCR